MPWRPAVGCQLTPMGAGMRGRWGPELNTPFVPFRFVLGKVMLYVALPLIAAQLVVWWLVLRGR